MNAGKTLTVAVGCLFSLTEAIAQPHAIDTEKSVMTVRVYKAGMLSGLGHDHEISAPVANGTVDTTSRQVELHVNARSAAPARSGHFR